MAGRGLGLVDQTGKTTKFGKIGQLLKEAHHEQSPLQKKVSSLVKKLLAIAALLVLLLLAIEYSRGTSLADSLIIALTFGMAAVPEEFPLVFTLYLSFGAWRLSKHGVLVKTLPSVESLGSVDVICVDKTGTLTEGKFGLIEIIPFGKITAEERNSIALLACEPNPVDSMEKAITERIPGFETLKQQWQLTFDYPFEPQGKHMTHVWTHLDGSSLMAMKGATEGVLEHCKLESHERDIILNQAHTIASEGKRILGLAFRNGRFTGDRHQDEQDLEFAGLLVFSDPIRSSAKSAIEQSQKSGIEIKMLTGDHYLTAHAIAHELRINHSDSSIYIGSNLEKMSPEDRNQAFLTGAIFARVSPEQKYELVEALQKHGKVVAMTGDGVNDSPALKLADIGVSMGLNATDVAKSTAKMVLVKNDFSGLVEATLEGRNIFANLRKSFSYLIAFHIPLVLLSFIPPLLGSPQLLMPVHIILLELVVHPVSAFAFENLKSSQTKAEKVLVPKLTAATSILAGTLLSLFSLSFLVLKDLDHDLNMMRSLMLSTILFGNIGLTLIETGFSYLSKRVLIILSILLITPFVLCEFSIFAEYLHLKKMAFVEYGMTFFLGLAASAPSYLIRRMIPKDFDQPKQI